MINDAWIWETKEGEKIHICEMKTSHLINTIKYIEKKNYIKKYVDSPFGWGADSSELVIEERRVDFHNIYYNMKRELAFRQLGYDFSKPREVCDER